MGSIVAKLVERGIIRSHRSADRTPTWCYVKGSLVGRAVFTAAAQIADEVRAESNTRKADRRARVSSPRACVVLPHEQAASQGSDSVDAVVNAASAIVAAEQTAVIPSGLVPVMSDAEIDRHLTEKFNAEFEMLEREQAALDARRTALKSRVAKFKFVLTAKQLQSAIPDDAEFIEQSDALANHILQGLETK